MAVENVSSFWDSQLFSALVGGSIMFLVTGFFWRLDRRSEKKKQKATNNATLQETIAALQKRIAYYEDVEQSATGDYYVLKATKQPICPVCWGKGHNAIPIYDNGAGRYLCKGCTSSGVFNHSAVHCFEEKRKQEDHTLQSYLNFDPYHDK